MAISFVNAALTNPSGAGTTVTANMPTGIAVDDLMILSVSENKAPIVVTDPADGWVRLDGPTAETAATQIIYYKFATVAGGGTAPTVTSDTSGQWRADVAVYRAVDKTTPFIAHGAQIESGSSTTTVHSAPTLNNTDAGAWGLFAGAFRQVNTPSSWTPGPGLTERIDADTGIAVSSNTAQCWDDSNGTVAVGNVTYTATSSSGSAQAIMWAGLLKPSSGGAPPPDTTAPSVPAGVTATANGPTKVTVAWSASTDDTAVSSYRVRRGGVDLAGATALTGTSFVDTTAAASTSYSYTVSAVDGAGNRSAESTAATVTTPAAPSLNGPITKVGTTGAYGGNVGTCQHVNPAGTAVGDFLVAHVISGLATGSGTISTPAGWTLRAGPVIDGQNDTHQYIFTRFADGTATDTPIWTSSQATDAVAFLVTALRGVDTTTPVNQIGSATGNGSPTTGVTMTTTVDNCFVINSIGDRKTDADGVTPRFTVVNTTDWVDNFDLGEGNYHESISLHNTARVQAVANAVPAQTYTQVSSTNGWAALQIAVAPSAGAPPADTTAPSVPTGVTATADSPAQVTVAWTASTDDTAVASYQIKRGGSVVAASVSGTSWVDTGVAASTTYSYTVSAVDAAGNRSAESAAATVTTPPASGGTPGTITRVGVIGGWSATNNGTVQTALPVGTIAGDYLVARTQTGKSGTIATPTGWTLVYDTIDPDGGDHHYVFARFADGTATDRPLLTSSVGTDDLGYIIVALRGVDAAAPINAKAVVTGTELTTVAATMSTTVDNCAVLNFVGDDAGSADNTDPRYTPNLGTTWVDGLNIGLSRDWQSLHSAYMTQATAGAVPGLTWTQHISALQNGYVVHQLAIKPSGTVAPPVAGSLTFGIVGTPDGDSVPVSVKTNAASSVRLQVAKNSAMTDTVTFTPAVTPDSSQYTKHVVSGLAADTEYWVQVEVDGTLNTAKQLHFKTDAPGTQKSFRVAFGSCLTSGNSTRAAFDNILANAPELFIHLGDWHYDNDTTTNVLAHEASLENAIAVNNGLNDLIRKLPLAYVWSDHDSGNNDWTNGPATWTASYNTAYRETIPIEGALPNTGGIYRSFGRGRVKFIMTDCRSFKSPKSATDDANKTMFGFAQEDWIAQELADPNYAVKVLCTDVPYVYPKTAGDDKWGGYTAAANRLVSAINAAQARVILIHGDAHSLCADDGSSANNIGGLLVAGAAPFGNSTSIKGGPYSQGTWPTAANIGTTEYQHGLLDFTDTGDTITVRFSGRDRTNTERVTLSHTWTLTTGKLDDAKVGAASVAAAYVGTQTVSKLYVGGTQIWP